MTDTESALNAEDRPLLLKALISYLVNRDSAAADWIKAGVSEDAYRNFIRLNARPDALRGAYPKLVDGVLAYLHHLRERAVKLPDSVLPLIEAVAPQKVSDKRVPHFLAPSRIRSEMGKYGGVDEFLRTYAGVYRLFRFTSDAGAKGRLNRGFLNIKPRAVLDEIDQETPCFTCVFRDGAGTHSDDQRPSLGLVFPYGRRILFLGSQLPPGQRRYSRNDGEALTMEWKPPMEPGQVNRAVGLYMGPNAAGQLISAVLFAYRIPDSEDRSRREYQNLRRSEISAVGRYDLDSDEDIKRLRGDLGEAEFEDLVRRTGNPEGRALVKV